jgi:hypothetical protein
MSEIEELRRRVAEMDAVVKAARDYVDAYTSRDEGFLFRIHDSLTRLRTAVAALGDL